MTTGSGKPQDPVEALFEQFLDHGRENFEAWVRAHPDDEVALREMWAAWDEFERVVREDDGPPRLSAENRRRYQLEGEVARGGMGVVYSARDGELGRRLALKVSRNAGGQARFEREARVTAQLDHPGVLPLHDIGRDEDGRPFFTMKLVEGQTLLEVLADVAERRDGWTPPGALGVLVKVCETLAFAHSRGVVHRDVKPQNIMVGRFGEVYVMDWGVAKLAGERELSSAPGRPAARGRSSLDDEASRGTLEDDVLGTPTYMAPEQADDPRNVDPRVDVYAVGAILYHLLAGHPPYRDRWEADGVLAALAGGPPTALSGGREAPPELEAISEKAMARDPRARYASMEELHADLTSFLEQRVVQAYRRGPGTEFRMWVARNRALSTSILAAAALVLGLLSLTVLLQARSNHRLDRALEDTERHAYSANIAAAQQMLLAGDVAGARFRLESCPLHLRGWEWDHLHARLDAGVELIDLRPLKASDGSWDPERGWLAWGTFDGWIGVIDVASREAVFELEGHDDWANDVELDPVHSDSLVSGGRDGWLRVWSMERGELEHGEMPEGGSPTALAFASDGRLAVGTADGTIEVRGPHPYPLVASWKAHEGWVWSLDWDPADGHLASSGQDNSAAVWDAAKGTELARFQAFDPENTFHHWSEVHWDASGQLLCGAFPDGSWHVWDVASRRTLSRGVDDSTLFAAIFGEEDGILITGATDSLTVWDWRTGRRIERIPGPERKVAHLEKKGEHLVAVDLDRGVMLFPRGRGRPTVLQGHRNDVCKVYVGPGHGWIASSSRDGTARVWDPATGEAVLEIETATRDSAAWGPDGQRLYTGTSGGELVAWGVPDGSRAAGWEVLTGAVRNVEVSPDGRWIAAGDNAGELAILDLETRGVLHRLEVSEVWSKPAFHPSRALVAISPGPLEVALLDLETGAVRRRLQVENGPVRSLDFDGAGRRLLAGAGEVAVLWDLEGDAPRTLGGHSDMLFDAIFFDGDRRIATAAADMSIKVWDPETAEELLTLPGHFGWVLDLAEDPDGRGIVSCSSDRTIRLWNTRNPWTH